MGDKEFYAKWIVNDYTITFDSNGGTGTMDQQVFTYGISQNLFLNEFVRIGYTFEGWATSKEKADNEIVDCLDGINFSIGDFDITLYAVWSINTYMVNFDANGGNGVMSHQNFDYGVPEPLKINLFTRTGYTFMGWATSEERADNGVVDHLDGASYTIEDSSVTLYAVWSIDIYYIVYNLDGGTNSEFNPDSYTIEDATIVLQDPIKIGHIFHGWYDNPECEGDPITEILTEDLEDKELYAKWEIMRFTVEFLDFDSSDLGISSQIINYGDFVRKPVNPVKGECIFDGWYKNIDYTEEYEFNAPVIENLTLYAKFLVKITFKIDSSIKSNLLNLRNIKNTLLSVVPSKTGYSFIHWIYVEENKIFNEKTEINLNDTITLEAILEANTYIIEFDLNYRTDEILESREIVYDSILTNLPKPMRKDYIFEGWYYGDTLITANDIYQIPDNILLEARWRRIPENYVLFYSFSGAIVLLMAILIVLALRRRGKHYKTPKKIDIDLLK